MNTNKEQTMNFDEYLAEAAGELRLNPTRTWGQVLYATLAFYRADLAEMIIGTLRDPFYVTGMGGPRIHAFLVYVEQNW
jgi:hypothetical protein